MTRDDLIFQIEQFAANNGVAPATVTSRAVGNSRLYRRLKAGGDCTLDIARRLIGYMDDDGPPSQKEAAE